MAFVYILRGIKNGRYYIGSTTDINNRLKHHYGGYTPSTKRFGPVELVFKQEFDSLTVARKVERWLKRLKRKDYLQKIIHDGYIKKQFIPR